MGCEAGLKPSEIDVMNIGEVWIFLSGYHRRTRLEWERTRAICYSAAASGADPKKFPNDPRKYMPFPWDKKETKMSRESILEQHARMVAKRKLFESHNKGKS